MKKKELRAVSPVLRAIFTKIETSGMTYRDLSRRELGLSIGTVSRYKRGRVSPRLEVLEAMGDVFGYQLEWVKNAD